MRLIDADELMAKAMIGTYVSFERFTQVLIDANQNKMGFRHEEKQNDIH